MTDGRVYPRVGGGTRIVDREYPPGQGLSPRGRGNLREFACGQGVVGSIPAWAGEPPQLPGPGVIEEVYPRVGGGTGPCHWRRARCPGLSPRGRGNLAITGAAAAISGSIPAWAGEPCSWVSSRCTRGVYPRVGGGTPGSLCLYATAPGLSPRGRGNLLVELRKHSRHGSIPAWAGEPQEGHWVGTAARVYPRVGGGTSPSDSTPIGYPGLSPRGRGNRRYHAGLASALGSIPAWVGEPMDASRSPMSWGGLSPRGRGNLQIPSHHQRLARSIPAWAGEPFVPAGRYLLYRVYPRVGGGTFRKLAHLIPGDGLSPRGRGNQPGDSSRSKAGGSIPAWAGEPRSNEGRTQSESVYPRVGGGTPAPLPIPPIGTGLSPRGRGNPGEWVGASVDPGSIPAWAGEPAPIAPGAGRQRVYPRVGGGTRWIPSSGMVPWGLSPRGRGNRCARKAWRVIDRSIPAWAGEPLSWPGPPAPWRVYPRVGGGTIPCPPSSKQVPGLSPRGRGNLIAVLRRVNGDGSIPAWAGEPCSPSSRKSVTTVYPRVGGGTGSGAHRYKYGTGLSPRGRGNHRLGVHCRRWRGSIPAWAGEPS